MQLDARAVQGFARKRQDKIKTRFCAKCQADQPHLLPRNLYGLRNVVGIDLPRGRLCLVCGWMHVTRTIKNPKLRKRVYQADNFECVYCGSTNDVSLDHIIPQARGGTDSFENLVTCCRSCNSRKLDGRRSPRMRYGRFRK